MLLAKVAFRSNRFSCWYKEKSACTCTDRLAFHRPGGIAFVPFFVYFTTSNSIQIKSGADAYQNCQFDLGLFHNQTA